MAKVDKQGRVVFTPQQWLMAAAYHQRPKAVKAALKAGAKVNGRVHRRDFTPLHWAGFMIGGNRVERTNARKVAQILLEAGANRNARDGNGRTPTELARENNKARNSEHFIRFVDNWKPGAKVHRSPKRKIRAK